MELKDSLPLIAIAISLISLGVTAWNVRFSRRAKLTELRACVLIKAAELTSRITRIHELHGLMRIHAEQIGDFEILKLLDVERVRKLQQRTDEAYRVMEGLPPRRGLDLYESSFHQFHDINGIAQDIERTTQKAFDKYLSIQRRSQSEA